MTTATANLRVLLDAAFAGTPDIGAAVHTLSYNAQAVFSDGTGANAIKFIFSDTRTLAASASENLDLAGSLVDALGNTLTFTKIRGIVIKADPTNVNNVVVGGAASNGFTAPFGDPPDTVVVRPGGFFCWCAPDATAGAVVASTGDLLKVLNSAGTTGVNYDVIIIGA